MDSRGRKLPAKRNYYVEDDHLTSKRCGIYSSGFLSNKSHQLPHVSHSEVFSSIFETNSTDCGKATTHYHNNFSCLFFLSGLQTSKLIYHLFRSQYSLAPSLVGMPRFAYSQLNADRKEIRLIKLLPGLATNSIEVEIFHVSLIKKVL